MLASLPRLFVTDETGRGFQRSCGRDDRIPVFIDGLPLAVPGSESLATLPVNLLQRIEVYRGVVPIRFGADALGGAINLVSRAPGEGFGGNASYEVGSFDRQLATGAVYYRTEDGFWLSGSGYYGTADNDYTIDVLLGDRQGLEYQAVLLEELIDNVAEVATQPAFPVFPIRLR